MGAVARRPNEELIDHLYALPPADFTRERNALAKEIGGQEGKRVRALPKPSASAWIVNQLYWRDRATYEELTTASDRLRAAHRAVLAGKKADLTGADAAHRDAVKAALTSTLGLAKEAGQAVSSATHNEITRTLETLSSEDPPGRLAKPLSPEGFEALRGMPIVERARTAKEEVKKAGRPGTVRSPSHLTLVKSRKDTERALAGARERERKEKAAVAALEKQVAAAERKVAASKAAWDRAQAEEARLRKKLREAEHTLDQAAEARRKLETWPWRERWAGPSGPRVR
jgi:hypothetical protein